MAKSPKKKDANAASAGADVMRQFEDAGLGQLNWMGAAWFEAIAEINSEIVSFVADRIKEDMQTQQELLHCKTPEDLQKAQLAFLEKAHTQYTDETGKIVKIGLDAFPGKLRGTKGTPL